MESVWWQDAGKQAQHPRDRPGSAWPRGLRVPARQTNRGLARRIESGLQLSRFIRIIQPLRVTGELGLSLNIEKASFLARTCQCAHRAIRMDVCLQQVAV